MELQLSDEQVAFVETTRRFLAAWCDSSQVRALEHDPDGFDRAVWQQGAQLGWTSLLVGEADGGGSFSEHGLSDLVLVAEELGRRVAPGPLVPVNVVAEAIGRHGSPEQRSAVLPGLLDGSSIAAWCGPVPSTVVTAGRGAGWDVWGGAAIVEAGAQATHLLVGTYEEGAVGQVLVAADAPGVTITPLDGLDLVRRFARVEFDGVEITSDAWVGPVGGEVPGDGQVVAAIARQEQVACVLQCAETVGLLDHVFAMTLEYLGDRYSFGRPLSSYQALKHRLADDQMWLQACHGIATGAARAVADEQPNAAELVSAAKAWIGPHATELIQDCVQMHGGIGVTWEHDLHLYLRRATVNRATYGTPEEHAERIAAQLLGAAS